MNDDRRGDGLPDGKVLLRFKPKAEDNITGVDDVGDEIIIVETPEAMAGLVVYGRYRDKWYANTSQRHAIRRLLQMLERYPKALEMIEQLQSALAVTKESRDILVAEHEEDESIAANMRHDIAQLEDELSEKKHKLHLVEERIRKANSELHHMRVIDDPEQGAK